MGNPGKKTTELWAVIMYAILLIANGTQHVNIPWGEVKWLGLAVIGYGGGRSIVKAMNGKSPKKEA